MATLAADTVSTIIPCLRYRDALAAIDWLCNAFGFRKQAVYADGKGIVANDPITGQGSNNAAKCAATYLRSILEAGDRPFDADWMTATFESYWQHARYVTDWTNTMLQPPARRSPSSPTRCLFSTGRSRI